MAAAGYYCFFTDHWYLERSLPLRTLVRGLRDLNAGHPGRMVLLQGIKSDLFWTGFTDGPFRLIGLNRVYLAPGSENIIEDHPAWGDATKLWTTAEAAANALNAGDAAAFDFDDGKVLRDITKPYKTVATAEYLANHRSRIDIASPVFASLLRSSPRSLTVELAGPASSNQALYVVAVSPKDSSLHLVVSADGKKLGAIALDRPGARQEFRFAMPKQFVGTYSMHVSIDADRPPIGIVASIGIK